MSKDVTYLCTATAQLVASQQDGVMSDWLAAWCNGNVVGRINDVAVRRARLVLGWVTVFGGYTTLVSLPSLSGQLSLLPSVER